MTLSEQLSAHLERSTAKRDQETIDKMDGATAQLAASDITSQALQVGGKIPSFTLTNATGQEISSDELLKKGPLVISFYRGGWCPYCNLELKALQEALPEIQQQGAELVAITPELPDASMTTSEKNNLTFQVLSDVKNEVASAFGLVFTLAKELQPLYEGWGIDLQKRNGDDSYELPLAATYVVSSTGEVTYAFLDVDYTKRMEPAKIVEVLAGQKVAG